MQRPVTTRSREALFRDAMEVIAADYASPLTLDRLASRLATSRRQLQRCFGEVGDTTFQECLTAERVKRATDLLAHEPQLRIHQVAAGVGYVDPSQFAKAFRRHHGVAPSDYRRERVSDDPSGRDVDSR